MPETQPTQPIAESTESWRLPGSYPTGNGEATQTFSYVCPTHNDGLRTNAIRGLASSLENEILCLPNSRERALALTNLEQSFMWAAQAILRHGPALPVADGGAPEGTRPTSN